MGYSRKFKLYYENDNVKITSISKNGEKQIYPEKQFKSKGNLAFSIYTKTL